MPTKTVITTTVETEMPIQSADPSVIAPFPEHLKKPALIISILLAILAGILFLLTTIFGVDLSRIFF